MSEHNYTPSLVVWTVQLRWHMFNCDIGDIWGFFNSLFVYLTVPGLGSDMPDISAAVCKLLVVACGVQFPD